MTFSTSISFMEIYIKTYHMAPTKAKASRLAQKKQLWLRERAPASIPLYISRNALRQTEDSPRGRPELGDSQIEEADKQQIDALVLKELQGQTTFILHTNCPHACCPPTTV
jgi:hypothetical protein